MGGIVAARADPDRPASNSRREDRDLGAAPSPCIGRTYRATEPAGDRQCTIGPGASWREPAAMARRKGDPAFHALTLDKPDVANLVGEEIAGLDQLTDSPLRDAEAFGRGDDGQKARRREDVSSNIV